MVLFVLSIVFLFAVALSLLTRKLSKDSEIRGIAAVAGGFFGVLFLVCLAWSSIKIVPANSVGIPVQFGNIGDPVDSGLNIMAPWTEVHTFSTRLQESSMLGDPNEGDRSTDDAVDVRGSDEGVVYMDVTVRYTVTKQTASDLFKRTGSMEGIRDRIIRPDTRSILRDVAKDFNASDLVAAKRGEVEAKATDVLRERMSKSYGINIDAVLLRGVRPSPEVEKAIQTKLQKAQEVEQALLDQQKQTTEAATRQKVAQADAESVKTKAQGEADATRTRAQAEADANAKISSSLTPQIIEKAKIDALQKGTVYVIPESGQFILGSVK